VDACCVYVHMAQGCKSLDCLVEKSCHQSKNCYFQGQKLGLMCEIGCLLSPPWWYMMALPLCSLLGSPHKRNPPQNWTTIPIGQCLHTAITASPHSSESYFAVPNLNAFTILLCLYNSSKTCKLGIAYLPILAFH